MKKILFLFVLLLCGATLLEAQERGGWSLGPRMSVYTNTGDRAMVGLGAYARYSFSDALRIEPSILALFSSGSSIDANCDLHYRFRLGERWDIFPLVGVAVNDMDGWAFGMNVGAGFDFRIAQRWDLTAGVKWMPTFKSNRRNPIAITIGGCYCF
uniref:outer membrane beta-barrel protein n=1 Tax=Alistipes sp. TaxID=1872444 RepID=UPI004056D382